MNYDPTNPLIVQGDRSILVEVDNPRYIEARDALAPFAELEKSPEHVHTYRLSNLSLWNAAAAGMSAQAMIDVLAKYSKFPLPHNLAPDLAETVSRFGRVKLVRHESQLRLLCTDPPLLKELARQPRVREFLGEPMGDDGFPVEDLAGYTEGAALALSLRSLSRNGLPFRVRDYQRDAANVFYAGGDVRGGSGVIVLPCGAGKTIVGIAAIVMMQKSCLILTTSITAVKQWIREILDKTDLRDEDVKEYSGECKEI